VDNAADLPLLRSGLAVRLPPYTTCWKVWGTSSERQDIWGISAVTICRLSFYPVKLGGCGGICVFKWAAADQVSVLIDVSRRSHITEEVGSFILGLQNGGRFCIGVVLTIRSQVWRRHLPSQSESLETDRCFGRFTTLLRIFDHSSASQLRCS
jgi:hypothetical protein